MEPTEAAGEPGDPSTIAKTRTAPVLPDEPKLLQIPSICWLPLNSAVAAAVAAAAKGLGGEDLWRPTNREYQEEEGGSLSCRREHAAALHKVPCLSCCRKFVLVRNLLSCSRGAGRVTTLGLPLRVRSRRGVDRAIHSRPLRVRSFLILRVPPFGWLAILSASSTLRRDRSTTGLPFFNSWEADFFSASLWFRPLGPFPLEPFSLQRAATDLRFSSLSASLLCTCRGGSTPWTSTRCRLPCAT